ncbi:uncharacterized protein LOC142352947 [Convolutriloba macropyga]|uniref:uncharacterized protein LOC142352947 n=1 Tax=Convolutriloba macropyga TaxID=536237 RepID=UPI003F527D7D
MSGAELLDTTQRAFMVGGQCVTDLEKSYGHLAFIDFVLKDAEQLSTLNTPRALSRNESLHSHNNHPLRESRELGQTDDTINAQLEDNLNEQNQLNEQIDELTNQNAELTAQLAGKEKEQNGLANQIDRLQYDLSRLKEEKAKLLEDLAAEKAEKKELSKKVEIERQNSADKLITEDKLETLREQLAQKGELVAKLESEIENKGEQIEQLRSQLHQSQLENARIASDLKHAQQMGSSEKGKVDEMLESLKAEKVELETLREQLAQKGELVAKLESEIENKGEQIEQLRSQLHQSQLENARIASDLKHAQQMGSSEKGKVDEMLESLKAEKVELQNQLKERTDSFNEKEQQSKDERDRLASELAQSVAEYKRDLAIAEARLQDSEELKKMGGKEVEQLKAEVDSLRQQVDSLVKKNSDAEVKNSELSVKLSLLEQMKEKESPVQEKTTPGVLASAPRRQMRLEQDEDLIAPPDGGDGMKLLHSSPVPPPSSAAAPSLQSAGISNLDQLAGGKQAAYYSQLEGLENEIERKRASGPTQSQPHQFYPQPHQPQNYANPGDVSAQAQVRAGVFMPPSQSGELWASLEQYRKEIEAQCRLEFNEKMAQVKTHLDEQNSWLSNLEKDRSEQENMLKREYNRRISDLELEIRKYRDLYGVTIPVRDNRGGGGDFHSVQRSGGGANDDPELKRLHSLLEKERKQREKLESRLEKMVDRDIDARAQILAERQRHGDISNSSTPLRRSYNSSLPPNANISGYYSTQGPPRTSSEFDAVLERVKQKLDHSISRHLGTTKLELELFGQHPYAAWDRSGGGFSSLNRNKYPRYTGGASLSPNVMHKSSKQF